MISVRVKNTDFVHDIFHENQIVVCPYLNNKEDKTYRVEAQSSILGVSVLERDVIATRSKTTLFF
jgi:hypothetical protein